MLRSRWLIVICSKPARSFHERVFFVIPSCLATPIAHEITANAREEIEIEWTNGFGSWVKILACFEKLKIENVGWS